MCNLVIKNQWRYGIVVKYEGYNRNMIFIWRETTHLCSSENIIGLPGGSSMPRFLSFSTCIVWLTPLHHLWTALAANFPSLNMWNNFHIYYNRYLHYCSHAPFVVEWQRISMAFRHLLIKCSLFFNCTTALDSVMMNLWCFMILIDWVHNYICLRKSVFIFFGCDPGLDFLEVKLKGCLGVVLFQVSSDLLDNILN